MNKIIMFLLALGVTALIVVTAVSSSEARSRVIHQHRHHPVHTHLTQERSCWMEDSGPRIGKWKCTKWTRWNSLR